MSCPEAEDCQRWAGSGTAVRIIGYNGESYGTRIMGAMVILLEADTGAPAADEPKPKTNS